MPTAAPDVRALVGAALSAFGVSPVKVRVLTRDENLVFRVDALDGAQLVLRIHRVSGSPLHPPRREVEVRSELLWLDALRKAGRDVPESLATPDGVPLAVVAADDAPDDVRIAVLFRRARGRFLDGGLRPIHLERVGAFMARLHEHARTFVPPEGFERWQIGDLSGGVDGWILEIIWELGGASAASHATTVLEAVDRARSALGTGPEAFGLIHADLHQENYLFHQGTVRAIDFDDCGWGHFAYDLMVALSELESRPDFPDLRAALLGGYRSVRDLPTEHEPVIEVLAAFRLIQLTLWLVERRDSWPPSDWQREVDRGLRDLALAADRMRTLT